MESIARILESTDPGLKNVTEQATKFITESRVWIILWTFCFILFILYPVICQNSYRRILLLRIMRCCWRIRYRRWDVSDIEERNDTRNSYMRNDMMSERESRSEINDDDWQNKQILILEKLADYTISLTKDDFIPSSTNDIESQDQYSIVIPQPGESLSSEKTNVVTEDCAICLGAFNVGDRICWSSNETCPHVYHEQCIIQWLVALLTKQKRDMLRRSRRNRNSLNGSNNTIQNGNNANATGNNNDNENNTTPEARESSPESENASTDIEAGPIPQSTPSDSISTPPEESSSKLSTLPRACPMCRRNFIEEKSSSCDDSGANEDDKCDTSSESIGTDYPSSQSSTSDEEMMDVDNPGDNNLDS